MSAGLDIKNLTMTGSEIPYTFPTNMLCVSFQAITTDISFYTATGVPSVAWTLSAGGAAVSIQNRSLAGKTVYFKAASGTLQIIEETGLGS